MALFALLLLAACSTATPAPTPTPTPVPIHLNADGSGDYPSLETAVQEAPSGAVLHLGPGIYELEGPLNVTRSLHLIGAGMDETVIVSEALGHAVSFYGEGPFSAEDISFRHEGDAAADVVAVNGGVVSFVRCRFTGAVRESELEASQAGLRLQGNTVALVQDCVATGNDNSGILVENLTQVTLERNQCTENIGVGIAFTHEASGTVRQNECTGNGLGGILVAGRAHPTVEENILNENGDTGLAYFETGSGMAQQNECIGNTRYGIFVMSNAFVELVDNNCQGNGEEDILDQRQ